MKHRFSDKRFPLFCSVLLVVCAAVYGFSVGFTPAPFTLRTKKLLMPASVDTYLMAENYVVWYFPVWKDLEIDYPAAEVNFECSGDVNVFRGEVDGHKDNKRVGKIIGRIEVNSEGMYSITASSRTKSPFVLALVPGRYHFHALAPFVGIDDNNFEPTWASTVEERESRQKKQHRASGPEREISQLKAKFMKSR